VKELGNEVFKENFLEEPFLKRKWKKKLKVFPKDREQISKGTGF